AIRSFQGVTRLGSRLPQNHRKNRRASPGPAAAKRAASSGVAISRTLSHKAPLESRSACASALSYQAYPVESRPSWKLAAARSSEAETSGPRRARPCAARESARPSARWACGSSGRWVIRRSAARRASGSRRAASSESGSAAGSCSRTTSSANTGPSGLVAHLPAHVGEEFSLSGGEALDTARRDLVEHPVDLCLRRIARRAARLEAGIAG